MPRYRRHRRGERALDMRPNRLYDLLEEPPMRNDESDDHREREQREADGVRRERRPQHREAVPHIEHEPHE